MPLSPEEKSFARDGLSFVIIGGAVIVALFGVVLFIIYGIVGAVS